MQRNIFLPYSLHRNLTTHVIIRAVAQIFVTDQTWYLFPGKSLWATHSLGFEEGVFFKTAGKKKNVFFL